MSTLWPVSPVESTSGGLRTLKVRSAEIVESSSRILFGFDDLGIAPAHGEARRIVTEIRDKHKRFQPWG